MQNRACAAASGIGHVLLQLLSDAARLQPIHQNMRLLPTEKSVSAFNPKIAVNANRRGANANHDSLLPRHIYFWQRPFLVTRNSFSGETLLKADDVGGMLNAKTTKCLL